MKRPDAEVLDELEAALGDLAEAEAAVKELKDRVKEITLSVSERVTDEALLSNLVSWLYWMVPGVNSKTLALALFGYPTVHRLRKIAGSVTAGIQCQACGADIQFGSRTALHAAIEANQRKPGCSSRYILYCEACTAALDVQRREQFDAEMAARKKRLHELRAMPYSEYLMTPEWQERRRHHLRSAGRRCQVCNTSNTRLNVHHRTYDSIGEERFVDLIVLCEDCHAIFHREGKLARG